MSLCIDDRYVTGIYALGQWFKVQQGSILIDAFEFTSWDDLGEDLSRLRDPHTNYQMGHCYSEVDQYANNGYPSRIQVPTGMTGISFIDTDTGERVSFSLMEVRAFRDRREF